MIPNIKMLVIPDLSELVLIEVLEGEGERMKSLHIYAVTIFALFVMFFFMPLSAHNADPVSSETAEVAEAGPAPDENSGEWRQWLGPNRDGISIETGLLSTWPKDGPREVWRQHLGGGFSGISVHGDQIYTMFTNSFDEYLICLDATNGKTVWRFRTDRNFEESLGGDGPRATPTIHNGMAYTLGALGKLAAVDIETGKAVWQKDVKKDLKGKKPRWGYSSSPLIHNDLVLVEIAGKNNALFVGLNKQTGELVWQSQSGPAGYSSPALMTINSTLQAVFFSGDKVVSLNPENGEFLWDYPWQTKYEVNAATPVFLAPNRIFLSSGYDYGCGVLEIAAGAGSYKAEKIWKNRVMKNHFATSIPHDGYIYGFDNSILKCINAETGEETWKERGFGKGSLIFADGKLIVLGEKGNLGLIEANPDSFQEITQFKVLKGKCWTVPTLTDGKLYIRNQREIACLDLTATE